MRSPKEGDLLRGRTPSDLARTMATRPVAGISRWSPSLATFGGSVDLLRARRIGDVPILRKDFHP